MKHYASLFFLIFCTFFFSCNRNPKAPITTENLVGIPQNLDSKNDPYFIHLSDIHLDASSGSVDYGGDTDTILWSVTKDKLNSILIQTPPPKFVVYTGDLAAHYGTYYLDRAHRSDHNKNLSVLLNDLRSLVKKSGVPFFYLPGNNDALAGDYYSFADSQNKTPFSLVKNPNNPFPALNTDDKCGDAPCIISDVHPSFGFYSARPVKGLKVIALNSVIFGNDYKEMDGVSHLDAGNLQMGWLYKELLAARDSSEKVIIAMHIPPGLDAYAVHKHRTPTNFWTHLPSRDSSWLNQFIGYTHTFKNEIVGILYGHTHMDEVRRIYNSSDQTNITEVAISSPGITPQHYNNPGFKTISFDASNKELLDFVTYYTTPGATVFGNKMYRFSEEFDCGSYVTIFDCINAKSNVDLNTEMDSIFKVKNGVASYDATIGGITVLLGQ